MDHTDHVRTVLGNDRETYEDLKDWAEDFWAKFEGDDSHDLQEQCWHAWMQWADLLKVKYEAEAEAHLAVGPGWLLTVATHAISEVRWEHVASEFLPRSVAEGARGHLRAICGR